MNATWCFLLILPFFIQLTNSQKQAPKCDCVPYYICTSTTNGEVYEFQQTLIDTRNGERLSTQVCPEDERTNLAQICCYTSRINASLPKPSNPVTTLKKSVITRQQLEQIFPVRLRQNIPGSQTDGNNADQLEPTATFGQQGTVLVESVPDELAGSQITDQQSSTWSPSTQNQQQPTNPQTSQGQRPPWRPGSQGSQNQPPPQTSQGQQPAWRPPSQGSQNQRPPQTSQGQQPAWRPPSQGSQNQRPPQTSQGQQPAWRPPSQGSQNQQPIWSVPPDNIENQQNSNDQSGSPQQSTFPQLSPGQNRPTNPQLPFAATLPGSGKQSCGTSFNVETRVNAGEASNVPWFIKVWKTHLMEQNQKMTPACGGSLILNNVVLTGAHCLENEDAGQIVVTTGNSRYSSEVNRIVLHPEYITGKLFYDFGLLFLKTPIPIGLEHGTGIICLPPAARIEPTDLQSCVATGFAPTSEVHTISVPIVPRDTCQSTLRTTRLGNYFKLHETFICAGGEPGRDTCSGDGGSPLFCKMANQASGLVQVGLVAWGIGCGDPIPGVYAATTFAVPWIDQVIQSAGLDVTPYHV